ncbi:MAG: YjbF family lipoprotein [Rhodospirillaceae bacterium]|nr:YjbF family lipoprotein [Rhodospirillaceae bacterium]
MTKLDQTRRSFLLGGALLGGTALLPSLFLGGCINSPIIGNAFDVAKAQVFGYPDLPLRRSTIAKLPYASMTARVGEGPQALLLLARSQGDEQHWISGLDRSVLALRGGRVVKTFGFPENLKDTRADSIDPVDRLLHKLTQPIHHTRYLDLDVGPHYGLVIDSVFESLGPRKLRIVELDFDTILVRERNVARTLNWRFENLYWVDPADGFVWKSTQTIARGFPPVHFQILKPPA